MQSHHYQVISFICVLVENDGQFGKRAGVELAEIDCVLFVAALQVLERRYAPVPFDDKIASLVLGLDENRVDVEPAVGLDACDKVSNVFPDCGPARSPFVRRCTFASKTRSGGTCR